MAKEQEITFNIAQKSNQDSLSKELNASLKKVLQTKRAVKIAINFDLSQKGLTQAERSIASLQKQAGAAGKEAETLGQKLKEALSEKFIPKNIFSHLLSGVREVARNVQQVDTAMTSLRSATQLSETAYSKFLDTAAAKSKTLGVNMSSYISTVADWSGKGYDLKDAEALAQASQLYARVGDGVKDVTQAGSTLNQILRGFKLQAEDAVRVVDQLNEVSGRYPLSAASLGEALANAGPALQRGGNSLAESLGLIAAAQAAIQDPAQATDALEGIALYLRAAKGELEAAGRSTEGMAQNVSQLRGELLALTSGKVDIRMESGGVKNTYRILQEMAGVWQDMTAAQQEAAAQLMGGNAVGALLANFATAQAAAATAMQSFGSAARENEQYLDSVTGKAELFTAQIQSLSAALMDSELIKFFLDLSTGTLSAVEGLTKITGALPPLLALLSGGLTLSGTKAGKVCMPFYASCEQKAA